MPGRQAVPYRGVKRMMIPLYGGGMGATTSATVPVPLAAASTPTAAAQPPITLAMLDPTVAQAVTIAMASMPQLPAQNLEEICPLCADPVTAYTNYLASSGEILASGLTPASVISNYASQINQVCSSAAARAQALGLTIPCSPPAASGTGSTGITLFGQTFTTTEVAIGAVVLVGALMFLGSK